MSRFAQFYETRKLFIEILHYKEPLTFEEWRDQPDEFKAGFLFVQFFDEILLAWDKADSIDFGEDGEGVSTVLQYLQKNVKQKQYYKKSKPSEVASAEYRNKHPEDVFEGERHIIEDNPAKFSSGYIYRTAYNCLYCICGHDRKCDKDRINYETSPYVTYDEKELCLFDVMADKRGSADQVSEYNSFEDEFWSIIEDTGLEAEKVCRYLLSQDPKDLKALTGRCKNYKLDPLRDIEVSLEAVDAILQKLRDKFLSLSADSPCGQYLLSNFQGASA